MIAVDHSAAAVMDALSSKYCPANKEAFVLKLVIAVAIFAGSALLLVLARSHSSNAARRVVAATAAAAVLLFAIGGTAWDLFGLSGCGSRITPGVLWNWPW